MIATSSIFYKPAHVMDAAKLEAFFLKSMTENFSYFPQDARNNYSLSWTQEYLQHRLSHQPQLLICAWANDNIIGLVSGTLPEGGVGTIIWLMVDNAWHNQGIGAELVESARQFYYGKQAHKIKLTVHNDKAVKFYLREGFIKEGFHKNHWWQMDCWSMAYFLE